MNPHPAIRPVLVLVACLAALLLPLPSRSQGPSPAPAPSTAPSPATAKPLDNKPVSGRVYLQSGFNYNCNGSDQINDFHFLDYRSNALTLDFLQFLIEKETTLSHPLGFRFNVSGGQAPRVIHANGLGTVSNPIDFTEFFLRYKAPLGNGLDLDVGKFMTPCGLEYTYAIDDPNYSRSFQYNYAGPVTHTGLRMKYDFSSTFNTVLYAVNGWDNFKTIGVGKTLGLCLNYNPMDEANFSLNAFLGPQQWQNTSNPRLLVDFIATLKPAKDWLLMINYDYGSEPNVPGYGNSRWQGLEGVVRRQWGDRFALALRAEAFNDSSGARTGYRQTLKSITFTPEFKLPLDIILRPEIRQDWSNVRSFAGGTKNSQFIFGLGLMYQYPFSF